MSRARAYAIRADDFSAEVGAIGAKRLLAILDCCHAAGMDVKNVEETAVEPTAFPLELPETKGLPDLNIEPGGKAVSDLAEGEGRAILNSSTGNQSSYVRSDGAMSLFTYHLIEALTGHAPHPDDATVVYVTDVMSWVTHKVKQSANDQGRDQTPVMRTSGVFPVAQLIGGQGVAKGLGGTPPDPLAPLPSINVEVGHAEGGVFAGDVSAGGDVAGRDMVKKEGGVHIDGGFNMSGGSFVGGDGKIVQGDEVHGNKTVNEGDVVHGDKVGGDKVGGDKISVGNVSGTGIAIGRGAQANVNQGISGAELTELFAPLLRQVAQENSTAVPQVNALKEEASKGEGADDEKMAGLIEAIAEAAPTAVEGIVNLFTNSIIAKAAGGATNYILKRIRK